jgi:DNA polymerase
MATALDAREARELLRYLRAIGIDELAEDAPVDRRRVQEAVRDAAQGQQSTTRAAPPVVQRPTSPTLDPAAAVARAEAAAAQATTLAELEAAVRAFDGCPLKATATKTVFADGAPSAALIWIGEAPGADEDRQGVPFVGASGRLLDRMLDAIGVGRSGAYVTNVVFWRPPGNRTPTADELRVCLPFVHRHLALLGPKPVILAGATAAQALLGSQLSIGKLRHRWHELIVPGATEGWAALATYHPSFLLRSPIQKREAWSDFLRIKHKLKEIGPFPPQTQD